MWHTDKKKPYTKEKRRKNNSGSILAEFWKKFSKDVMFDLRYILERNKKYTHQVSIIKALIIDW